MEKEFVERVKFVCKSKHKAELTLFPLQQDRSSETEVSQHENTVYIPIIVKWTYAGYAIATCEENRTQYQINEMVRAVKMILEPAMYRYYLESTENNSIANDSLLGDNKIMEKKSYEKNTWYILSSKIRNGYSINIGKITEIMEVASGVVLRTSESIYSGKEIHYSSDSVFLPLETIESMSQGEKLEVRKTKNPLSEI